jgi:hypothetical protein
MLSDQHEVSLLGEEHSLMSCNNNGVFHLPFAGKVSQERGFVAEIMRFTSKVSITSPFPFVCFFTMASLLK